LIEVKASSRIVANTRGEASRQQRMRTILIPMRGRPGDSAALETGAALARHFDSHLCGLYPRLDIEAGMHATLSIGSRGLVCDWLKKVELDDAQRARHAQALFESMLLAHDIPAGKDPEIHRPSGEWREQTGDCVGLITDAARFHDLVVCAPPSQEGESRDELASIVTAAGRPVLLATDTPPRNILHTVVVAWKNTREAAHAVTAAMPLLQKARRVVVMTANEGDQDLMECVDCAERLAQQLRWHGIKAEGRISVLEGRDAPRAVIDCAREIHADLLVMCAYGHSRAREFIVGGFTRHVLNGVPLPVFLCH
jgi:nucleotide-binding universal stress UspA family protein